MAKTKRGTGRGISSDLPIDYNTHPRAGHGEVDRPRSRRHQAEEPDGDTPTDAQSTDRPCQSWIPYTSQPKKHLHLRVKASLFLVVRQTQLRTAVEVMSSAVDGLSGRSLSLKMPLTRKARFRMREWVQRSGSTRTTRTSGLSRSNSPKSPIKHLRSGRLEEVEEKEVEGSTRNTTVLVPEPKRAEKSRANSMDSRVTQWLDFYTGPPELTKSQSQPLPEPLPGAHPPSRQARPGGPHTSADFWEAPLRVPSSEGCRNPSTSLKPPPRLLAQPKQPETGTAVFREGEAEEGERDPEPATSSRGQQNTSSEPDDLGFLPLLRFDTPPPTPNSSAGGVRKPLLGRDKGKGKEENGALALESEGDDAATVNRNKTQREAETVDLVRYNTSSTRQERIWLHINYRGETPFLQAWGLDITKLADRIEGLAILRELIQAEGERTGMGGAQAVVQGPTSSALAVS